MSKVLLDERGVFAGVILVSLGPDYFRTLLKSVLYAPDMLSSLIHGDGKVIFRIPDTQGITGVDLAARPGAFFIQHMKSGKMTNVFKGIVASTGEARVTYFRTIQSAAVPKDKLLVIVVSRDLKALFASWREDAFVLGGLFLLLILASTLGLYTYQQRQSAYKRLMANQDAERKQAEEDLRESEQRFRELAELLPETIFETDIQGTLNFVNRNAFDQFGYTQDDYARGLNVLSMIVHDDRGRALENIQRIMKGKSVGSNEFTMQRKDESTFPAIIHSSVAIHDGKPVGLRGFVVDITERKRAEEETLSLHERLQRAEKMESLGTLAGGVAHDLNNVLGIVVGYAELILDSVDESNSIKPHLVNIMNGGQKAAAIVEDLLTLARRGVQNRSILNLNKMISDFQKSPEFVNLCSHHSSVKIITDLESDLLNISGSSVHLGKSLYNLVSNASEAMPKGGTVTIKTTNQYLDKPIHGYDQIREGDYVVFSVSDTGEGISANDLKRIFEPFYTKKIMGRSGTGLGLAVVWGTVKDLNGYINVASEEGKGSIFTLYFPVIREDITTEATAVAISEYMGKGESILVVDDVKEQCDLAAGMLRTLDYSVSSVLSGEEAVAYLKEHQADLIVLDMIMDPGMDGLETYRSIIEIRPKQKAIIVSGFSESDRVHDAHGLGVGAYVKKPYVKEKLGVAVRKELDRVA